MKRRLLSPTRRSSAPAVAAPLGQLLWSDGGINYRVTAWPDAIFERQDETGWVEVEPSETLLAQASVQLSSLTWRRYLEFVPTTERAFLEQFGFGRLHALWTLRQAPELFDELNATPAVTSFLVHHAFLRGSAGSRWAEVRAVFERGGTFALLEWLGLPATRDTLTALGHLVEPDVPLRLLEPLRRSLWHPATMQALQRTPAVTDRQLAHFCHALAA